MRAAALLVFLAAACEAEGPPCGPRTNSGCPPELQCEPIAGQDRPACLPPVVLRGKVHVAAGGTQAIAGARVIVYSEDGARPLTAAVTTTALGLWEARVRAPRDPARQVVPHRVQLRVAAAGYGSFPDGWTGWPVIDVAVAREVETPGVGPQLVVSTADTDVGLVALAGGPGIGTLCGQAPPLAGPTASAPAATDETPLVVAEFDPILGRRAVTGYPDETGAFLLFGLPPGEVRATAYARGQTFVTRTFDLNSGENACRDVGFGERGAAATVSGLLTVPAGTARPPTVRLVLASTYDDARRVGASPPGLSVTSSSDFHFTVGGVPPGRYRVLVSPENDGLVQLDAPPAVDVTDGEVTVPAIRVVAAVPIVAPGATAVEAVVDGATLSFEDVDGEVSYRVVVRSYLGTALLTRDEPPRRGGTISLTLDRLLLGGMFYRLEIEARDEAGHVLTRSEEGRGIFHKRP